MSNKILPLVGNNEFFDSNTYIKIVGLKSQSESDAALHFFDNAINNASEIKNLVSFTSFDSNFYLEKYTDVSKSNINPLVHYLRHGYFEGRYFRAWNEDEESALIKSKTYFKNEKFHDALQIINNSTLLKTRHPEILIYIADIYHSLSYFEEQEKILSESFTKYPRHLPTLISYGKFLLNNKKDGYYSYWSDFVEKHPRVEQGYLYLAESIKYHSEYHPDDINKIISYYPNSNRKKILADAIQIINTHRISNEDKNIKNIIFANSHIGQKPLNTLIVSNSIEDVKSGTSDYFSPAENNFEFINSAFKYFGPLDSIQYSLPNLYSISERTLRNCIAKSIDTAKQFKLSGIDFTNDIQSLVILKRIAKSLDINNLEYESNSIKINKDKNIFPFSIFGNGLQHLVDRIWIEDEQLLSSIENAVVNEQPLSFVRLGHGENRVLGYNYSFSKEDADHTTQILFGEKFSHEILDELSYYLKQSFTNADIIGTPIFRGFDSRSDLKIVDNTSYIHLRDFNGLENTLLCDVNVHLKALRTKKFGKLLKSIPQINIIASRKVDDIIQKALNVSTHQIYIPTEHAFSDNDINRTPVKGKHYPDYFMKIMENIKSTVKPGSFYLVGAGILGKIYCNEIKKYGGVAIDVGSLIDGIAGLKTRTICQDVEWLNTNNGLI